MTDGSAIDNKRLTEADRLAALASYDVLDTDREPGFDHLAELVADICETPVGLVSLVDGERLWFKAGAGLEAREVGRERSLCTYAVENGVDLQVTDALADPRFADTPLVSGAPHIRFYAAALLRTPEGAPVGTLCVIDTKARPGGLTDRQKTALHTLAEQVMAQLELRKAVKAAGEGIEQARRRDLALATANDALSLSEARFHAIADSLPQMVWSALPDGSHDYFNSRWYEFTGVAEGGSDGKAWIDPVHPDDQDLAMSCWRDSLSTGEACEVEYRLRHHSGVYRWTLARALPIRDAQGGIVRWFGACTDIDDLKRMEQGKELLSQELSHRIKNIFAVVSALIALSARQYPEAKSYSQALRTRISALARAHEFVRPHTETSRPTVGDTTLHTFLADLFRPYVTGSGAPRVVITGDDAAFDDQAATSVALLFHELATNAAKYGALSTETGRVMLKTERTDERYILAWEEVGGPLVLGEPARSGFGSSLATLSVEGQLGGRLERTWAPQGLKLIADLPVTALSRRRAALQSA